MKSTPIIDYDKWQDGDEGVIETCPVNVFEKQDDKVVVARPDECIGCRSCESQFPHSIKIVEEGDGDIEDPQDEFTE